MTSGPPGDITKMRGPTKGIWYHAHVVIDIFSRYVVGWCIETVGDGELAADLVADAIAEQGRAPGYLHADGGAAMTSKPLASLLCDLDITRSHNRPRVRVQGDVLFGIQAHVSVFDWGSWCRFVAGVDKVSAIITYVSRERDLVPHVLVAAKPGPGRR
ncbi:integrase catalytic domain-containing protein [Rhodococcus qingshengii]|uniref:integrase catalytic domain-containing protein n=1 Tax=Rhodococcus TaxID=1827 RepID=UPI0009B7B3DD|nr:MULTISPECIES: DDE-type integrase/transposase/recombinase [Rhodococcus]MCZ4570280.1 transposase family protein [Rhodococcus erythropolis]MCZ4645150.1 transposase family protein [Rhodococcus erythropolis]MDJ0491231.1 transposase family protein [Rhodococcus qingshengii]MDV8015844.1 transposase family protein [Rhodococcus sp. IEGM 1241]